jgi:hypothetical protein
MVPLLLSSALALAVIIERGLCWRRFRAQEGSEQILALVAASIHAAHITRQRVVDLLPLFQANFCVGHNFPPHCIATVQEWQGMQIFLP